MAPQATTGVMGACGSPSLMLFFPLHTYTHTHTHTHTHTPSPCAEAGSPMGALHTEWGMQMWAAGRGQDASPVHSLCYDTSAQPSTQNPCWNPEPKMFPDNCPGAQLSHTWSALEALSELSLCLPTVTHTGTPMGVAVSHCITRFQTRFTSTMCQIRYHSHWWWHRSTAQL